MGKPFVSVVVPHRGNSADLERCLLALSGQTYPQENFEVIVVLGESAAEATEALFHGNIQRISRQKNTVYAARNDGIRRARGTVIALTDSDAIPDSDWIERSVELVGDKEIIVAGEITLMFSSPNLSPAACYEKLFAFDQEKNARSGRCVTANLITAKSVFSNYEYFREDAVTGEDFRWSQQLVSLGVPIVFSELAGVTHPARETASALLRKTWRDSFSWRPQLRPRDRIARGYRFWKERYLTLPSSSRLRSCGTRELFLALMMFQAVQSIKFFGFMLGMIKSRKR